MAESMQPHENNRTAIRNLQHYLRQLSYTDPRIPAVPIDGIWNSDTQRAVEAFQRIYRLPVTGKADRRTWEMLYKAYLISLAEYSIPLGIFPFPRTPANYSIGPGDTGDLVLLLNHMLATLSDFYGKEADTLPSGNQYSGHTDAAVRAFQQVGGLPPTGRVDLLTWNGLAQQFNCVLAANQ